MHFVILIHKSDKDSQHRMKMILVMVFLTMIYFTYYAQTVTSITLAGIHFMRGKLFGVIPVPPEATLAMNSFWCFLAGPVTAYCINRCKKRKVAFSIVPIMSLSFLLTSITFGLLTYALTTLHGYQFIKPEFFLLTYFFFAFSEVILGSQVVVFILSIAPKETANFSASLYSLAVAVSGIFGTTLATTITKHNPAEVSQSDVAHLFGHYFLLLAISALFTAVMTYLSSHRLSQH